MSKPFSDAYLRSLAPPATGRLDIADARCPGLTIRMTVNGVRSWSFRFRDPITRAPYRHTLGTYPDVGLKDARERASELRRQVAAGVNPVEAMRKARHDAETNTFGALAERYLKEYAYRFKRSAEHDARNLRLHVLPHWAKRPYAEIQRRDVIELCEGMVQSGRVTHANRVQALISGVFSFAIDADLVAVNPCHRLKKRGVEHVGTRVLSDREIELFWNGIMAPPVSRPVGLALRLALLTGVRSGEATMAACDEFEHLEDSARAAWLIPAARSKNRRAHFVPLSQLAAEIVREAQALAPVSPYVFPLPLYSRRADHQPCPDDRHDALWPELTANSDAAQSWRAEPPSPHDLRRTFATRLASLGASGEDVSALLNHTPRGVTAIHYNLYNRAAEKRRALTLWAAHIERILGVSAETSKQLRATEPRSAREQLHWWQFTE